jgi:hypothetical protein
MAPRTSAGVAPERSASVVWARTPVSHPRSASKAVEISSTVFGSRPVVAYSSAKNGAIRSFQNSG